MDPVALHLGVIIAGLLQLLALPVGMGIGTLVVPRLTAVVISAIGGVLSVVVLLFL